MGLFHLFTIYSWWFFQHPFEKICIVRQNWIHLPQVQRNDKSHPENRLFFRLPDGIAGLNMSISNHHMAITLSQDLIFHKPRWFFWEALCKVFRCGLLYLQPKNHLKTLWNYHKYQKKTILRDFGVQKTLKVKILDLVSKSGDLCTKPLQRPKVKTVISSH